MKGPQPQPTTTTNHGDKKRLQQDKTMTMTRNDCGKQETTNRPAARTNKQAMQANNQPNASEEKKIVM